MKPREDVGSSSTGTVATVEHFWASLQRQIDAVAPPINMNRVGSVSLLADSVQSEHAGGDYKTWPLPERPLVTYPGSFQLCRLRTLSNSGARLQLSAIGLELSGLWASLYK